MKFQELNIMAPSDQPRFTLLCDFNTEHLVPTLPCQKQPIWKSWQIPKTTPVSLHIFTPWKQLIKVYRKQKQKNESKTIFQPRHVHKFICHLVEHLAETKNRASCARCSGITCPSQRQFRWQKLPGIFIFFQRRLCCNSGAIERSLSRRVSGGDEAVSSNPLRFGMGCFLICNPLVKTTFRQSAYTLSTI